MVRFICIYTYKPHHSFVYTLYTNIHNETEQICDFENCFDIFYIIQLHHVLCSNVNQSDHGGKKPLRANG
jgi:hypothetical protein